MADSRDLVDAESAFLVTTPRVQTFSMIAAAESTLSQSSTGNVPLQIWRMSRAFVAVSICILWLLIVHRSLPRPSESGMGFQEIHALQVLSEFASKPHAYDSVEDKRVATQLATKMKSIVGSWFNYEHIMA